MASAEEILNKTDHRPIALPQSKWIMSQAWSNVLFAHWPIKPDIILPYIPKRLELELWEGQAWITLSPFQVEKLRIRGLQKFPYVSPFYELNLRTYVTYNGKQGIYPLSLDASNRLVVELSRLVNLPYLNSEITMNNRKDKTYVNCFRKDRRQRAVHFSGSYSPASDEVFHASPEEQLYWLTERYSLYTANKSEHIYTMDIHHLPWPLQKGELEILTNTIPETIGIHLNDKPPIVTYTKSLDVLIWPIRRA